VIKEDTIDVRIDGRRTLAARYPEQRGEGLFLFAHCARVVFGEVSVRPLV